MNKTALGGLSATVANDTDFGAMVARLIWDDHPDVNDVVDPRTAEFANAVIMGLGHKLIN